MELLHPLPPHHHDPPLAADALHRYSPPPSTSSRVEFHALATPPEAAAEEDKVHVAVGKSVGKGATLLQWAFSNFTNPHILLLHVHQPSPFIPTLLGKLPASQANPEVVSAFRREEKEQAMRLLDNYLRICRAAKVKASFMMTEADQVQKGIVDLVVGHNIRRLVIGAIPEGWMKVKRNSRKANYAAKNAPSFCKIWFIYRGKHIWTREASEKPCSLSPCETIETEGTFAAESTTSSGPLPQNSAESSSDTHLEAEEERVNSQLVEVKQEADEAADESFVELLKLEAEATEAIRKVNLFESAHAQEVKLRQEAEDELRTTDCGEQALSLVDTLIRSGSVDVIVVDSVAALVPKGELDGEMGDAHMAMQARLMSQALRKLSHSLSVSQCILIFINQVRSKLSTFGGFGGPQEVTCGGNALKFYASVRLNIRRIGFVKKGEEILGSQVLVKVVKNKLAPPFKTAEFELQFGKGINRECEIIDLSVKHKIILKAGAMYYFNDKNFRGRDAFKSFLAENHSAFEELQMKLREKLLDDTEVEKVQDSDVTSDVKEEITTTLESTDEESSAAVEA